MTADPRKLHELLQERLDITQEIAAANVEHLRLNQKASGMMVLGMKEDELGEADAELDAERLENFRALEVNMNKINDLEAKLKSVDNALEIAAQEEKNDRACPTTGDVAF